MGECSLRVEDFDFKLPEELIAQTPLENRTESRLLVMDRITGEIQHKQFSSIVNELQAGDCLVLNDTKVLPARLYGTKEDTGAKVELLLLKDLGNSTWETLAKPAKRLKEGTVLTFGEGKLTATVVGSTEFGGRKVEFSYEGVFYELLEELGDMPLPPYITEQLDDKDRYQTVFAKVKGSAAAPTAGLHFTKELLEEIQKKGVHIAFITLHVGLGTFRPVQVETIENHKMHSEFYHMSAQTAKLLRTVREKGGRIISVGTTSTRTLETIVRDHGTFTESSGWTDIFLYPGYEFRAIDGLLTNFHLPKSTLLMLISAFSNREHILSAYEEAVRERYRFFSFGDAMLIVEGKKDNL